MNASLSSLLTFSVLLIRMYELGLKIKYERNKPSVGLLCFSLCVIVLLTKNGTQLFLVLVSDVYFSELEI